MNIKSRLKKMENQITKEDSEFCSCEKGVRFIITPNADGKGKLPDGKPLTEPPEFCEKCDKQRAEPFHATFTINPSVELSEEA